MRRPFRKPRSLGWPIRPQPNDADAPLSAEARYFAEALSELPAAERSALALSEIGGLPTDEIAERLGTSPEVVRALLERARRVMQAKLNGPRGGLTALLPFQSWFSGSTGPAIRTAGAVAAAVIGTGVAVSSVPAGAEGSRPAPKRGDVPRARIVDHPRAVHAVPASAVRVTAPSMAASVVKTERRSAPADGARTAPGAGGGGRHFSEAADPAPRPTVPDAPTTAQRPQRDADVPAPSVSPDEPRPPVATPVVTETTARLPVQVPVVAGVEQPVVVPDLPVQLPVSPPTVEPAVPAPVLPVPGLP